MKITILIEREDIVITDKPHVTLQRSRVHR